MSYYAYTGNGNLRQWHSNQATKRRLDINTNGQSLLIESKGFNEYNIGPYYLVLCLKCLILLKCHLNLLMSI